MSHLVSHTASLMIDYVVLAVVVTLSRARAGRDL